MCNPNPRRLAVPLRCRPTLCSVSEKKARAWCASKGNIPYIETSAKEGINIEDAFQVIAKNALKTGEEEEIYLPDTIDVGSSSQQRSSGCEC
ncbi:hypothetical protein F511_22749 [Dorcoceras hygrometricum]|uniref:Uncharacterized protein n=1 Tax=Dorcoceras hygrometricum TaxID=472368 RepID=A0A2Z7BZ41_9LAMI|nr:hypothetical protein F511_22749 [Dorcoceras hygrometricum]